MTPEDLRNPIKIGGMAAGYGSSEQPCGALLAVALVWFVAGLFVSLLVIVALRIF